MCAKYSDFRVGVGVFIKKGAAAGVGATTLAGLTTPAMAVPPPQVSWDRTAEVVIAGAGASGVAAAIMARDGGATVIVIEENHSVGGHAILSGGNVPLGGGTSMQKKHGIVDSADQVYIDHTNPKNPEFRYADRELVRVWADENAPTFEFLLANGVRFIDDRQECERRHSSKNVSRSALFDRSEGNHQRKRRFGCHVASGSQRARKRSAVPAVSQADAHRKGEPVLRPGFGNYVKFPGQGGAYPGHEGRNSCNRRPYE